MGLINKTLKDSQVIASENVDTYIAGAERLAVQIIATDVGEAKTVDAASEVDITNDILTSVAHGYIDNTEGQLTSTGTLPAGLSLSTDYYIVNKTTDTFQLSASEGGAAIDITDRGTTTQETSDVVVTKDAAVKEITQIICTAEDANTTLDGKYFILQDDVGTVAFWFDVDDSGTTEPAHGADRGVEITTVATADLIGTVGTAVYNAIIADSKFAANADDTAGTIKVESSTYGVKAAAEDGDSGFTTSEDTAGVDSDLNGKYFLLADRLGTVAFWLDVVGGATEPAHGADRSIEITTVGEGDAIGTVGTAVYNAIIADSKFEAGSDDTAGTLVIKNTEYGNVTGQAAGDSGFTVAEKVAGTTSTITFTPTTVSGASVTIQKSCDGVNWVDVASGTNITGDATFMVEDINIAYRYMRVKFAITTGFMRLKAILTGWGSGR